MELGSRLARGNVAGADSSLMLRFRRAGLVTFGRTATPEMAYSITTEPLLYGATRNPWDPDRSAGGSSGGAAAAVAAGIVPIAHATDAAGSLRIPAACNGLFGLKPTRGRVSMGPGADEVFNGLAVHGSVSRTVRDSAVLLDRIRGPEPGDPYVARQPSRPYAQEVTRPRDRCGSASSPRRGRPPHHAARGRRPRPDRTAARIPRSPGGGGRGRPRAGWEEFVLANARLMTANLTAQIDELAAAFGRPVDSSTLEPLTLAGYDYGRRVTGAQFVTALTIRNRVARSLARYFGATTCSSLPPFRNCPCRWAR